jgi:CRISPR-associated protein Csb2
MEIVRVLCADPIVAFENTHTPMHEQSTGKGKSKQTVKTPLYSPNWHLCMETAELHAKKWSDPPGSRWVSYWRQRGCFKIKPVRVHSIESRPLMQVARFTLDSAVLPLITETLPTAELARRALMCIYGNRNKLADGVTKGKTETFSGKNAESEPLSGHGHAYFLPTDEDGDGRLDHLTVVSSNGFNEGEQRALEKLSELKSEERDESGHKLRLLLMGLGRLGDYKAGPVDQSTSWVSVTPFIAQRHLKKRGTKRDSQDLWHNPEAFLKALLQEELARLPSLKNVELSAINIDPESKDGCFRVRDRFRPLEFKRNRMKRNDDGATRQSGAFRITFPSSFQGPLALGHSSHFGMGLFLPVTSKLKD